MIALSLGAIGMKSIGSLVLEIPGKIVSLFKHFSRQLFQKRPKQPRKC